MAKKKTLYSVHPSIAMVQKWVATLPEKTGRSLEEWIALVKQEGPPDEAAQRAWLKDKYKLGTNSAWWIAERIAGKGTEDDSPELYLQAAERYVAEMFAGSKAGMRPVYDALLDVCLNLAPDVKACPCQTIVPLYRKHVFAQIKPTTRTRIDFGFALKDTPATGRLIDTGGFAKKDRITHRIEIKSLDDIDAEVKHWLKVAYELDV
jgi:hypothetical protein